MRGQSPQATTWRDFAARIRPKLAAPLWRLEEFPEEYRKWAEGSNPSSVWRRLVLDRAIDLEEGGPTDDGVYLSADADGYELLEPIRGTTTTISCLVFPQEGRIIVIDIRS